MGNFTPRNAAFAAARNLHRYRKLGVATPALSVGVFAASLLDGRPWYVWVGLVLAVGGAAFAAEKADLDHAAWGLVALAGGLIGTPALGYFDRTEAWPAIAGWVFLAATPAYAAWWFVRDVVPRGSSNSNVERSAENAERKGGMASRLDVAQHVGPGAARALARQIRPSYVALTDKELRKVPLEEYAVLILKTGFGWLPGEKVWEPLENISGHIGAPRTGKTQSLAEKLITAPGALVVTSTKADLAMAVHPFRNDRRWHLVNPFGLGKFPSNVRWSVLEGCEDYNTAIRRAKALMPYSPDSKVEHWRALGRPILGLMVHAAARSGKRMADVQRWAANTESERSLEEITSALAAAGESGPIMASQIKAHWGTNKDTRTSIDTAIHPGLLWMANDEARVIGDSKRNDLTLNFRRFFEERETIYLLGPDEEAGTIAPLIAAIVAELGYIGRKVAAESTAGRLDPPCTFGLDEAPNVCPVPLDKWTSYFGSQGLPIHWACQSLAQMRDRWGDEGAGTIVNNTSSFLYSGGSNSAKDLVDISTLLGETRRRIPEADEDSRDAYRWTSVLSPGQIRALEAGEVLLLRRGMRPMTGWAPQIRERKDHVPMPLVEVDPAATKAEASIPEQSREVKKLDR